MLKRSGLKAKKNRIRRRFSNISGDFFAAMGLLLSSAVLSSVVYLRLQLSDKQTVF